ncbi:MAG: N-acetyltransferase, partial [Pseudomonas sp.]|nr:N-acetyltransferase [Pseudomonas sp.]
GLHVTPHNPALRLYQRCGFEVVGETGLSLKMRRAALTTAIRA